MSFRIYLLILALLGAGCASRSSPLRKPAKVLPMLTCDSDSAPPSPPCRQEVLGNLERRSALIISGLDGIEDSSSFLLGCTRACLGSTASPQCHFTTGLHVPSSWMARCLPAKKANVFFDPKVQNSTNNDAELEKATLLFFAGHGAMNYQYGEEETSWALDEDWVRLKETSLGDIRSRYLWMNSCNVMEHGDRYGKHPEKFDPLIWNYRNRSQVNVFYRWGRTYISHENEWTPLNPSLRMACGGSTTLFIGNYSLISSIWSKHQIQDLPISESFILGLGVRNKIPLCIARGGAKAERSPMFQDRDFKKRRNPFGNEGYIHIQYPVHCAQNVNFLVEHWRSHLPYLQPRLRDFFIALIQLFEEIIGGNLDLESRDDYVKKGRSGEEKYLPVYFAESVALPTEWEYKVNKSRNFGFIRGKIQVEELGWMAMSGSSLYKNNAISFQNNPASGATLFSARDGYSVGNLKKGIAGVHFLRGLVRQLQQLWRKEGVISPKFGEPRLGQMRFDLIDQKMDSGTFECARGCFVIEWPILVPVNNEYQPLYGEAGSLFLRICPGRKFPQGAMNCGGQGSRNRKSIDCPFAGEFDFNFSLVGLRLDEKLIEWRKGRGNTELLRELRAQIDKLNLLKSYELDDSIINVGELGYRSSPLNCALGREPGVEKGARGGKLYPVYRYEIPRREGGSPLVIEIPAVNGVDDIQADWECWGPGE